MPDAPPDRQPFARALEKTPVDRTRRFEFAGMGGGYEAARPGYPAALFESLQAVLNPPARGARALEIGCGTGKATGAFLDIGYAVQGIDIAPDLLSIASKKFAGRPFTAALLPFERFEADPASFDLVFCAQAWHWIDAAVGYGKVHDLLTPGGWVALIWNVRDIGDGPLRDKIDAIYKQHAPGIGGFVNRVTKSSSERAEKELEACGLFYQRQTLRSRWSQNYSADEYCDLLGTYSDHKRLPQPQMAALQSGLRALIAQNGGKISVDYDAVAVIGRKAPA